MGVVPKSSLNFLYVGPLFPGSTALHRMWALENLGCKITAIDTTLPFGRLGGMTRFKSFANWFAARTNKFADWKQVHRKIQTASRQQQFDVLWVDKGQFLKPEILLEFRSLQPRARIVNYSPDDMFNPNNQTERWKCGLGIYDLFVTTKSFNVAEYLQSGARDVLFVEKAFEPSVHKPQILSIDEQMQWSSDAVFVGACELERKRSIESLAKTGISLGLYGGGQAWPELSRCYSNIKSKPLFLADELYAKILCASKIALGFLRKENRDLQTARSIEIPACGVFMLAERTDEHLSLFEEGKEAEFFESDEELAEKVKYYLQHESQRKRIANAGRERCLTSRYSNPERLRKVLQYLDLTT